MSKSDCIKNVYRTIKEEVSVSKSIQAAKIKDENNANNNIIIVIARDYETNPRYLYCRILAKIFVNSECFLFLFLFENNS